MVPPTDPPLFNFKSTYDHKKRNFQKVTAVHNVSSIQSSEFSSTGKLLLHYRGFLHLIACLIQWGTECLHVNSTSWHQHVCRPSSVLLRRETDN